MKISSASICLNEIGFIDRFFRYVVNHVDEVVIVDGGSTDGTWEVIKDWQAKSPVPIIAIQNPMPPSFAEQRNLSLSHCTGDWILHIDIDELYSKNLTKAWMASYASQAPLHIYGVSFPTYYVVGEKQNERCNNFLDPHVRFFRNSKHIRYFREIHESVCYIVNPEGNLADRYTLLPMKNDAFSATHVDFLHEFILLDYGKTKNEAAKKEKWQKMKQFSEGSARAGIPISEDFYLKVPKAVGMIPVPHLPPDEFLIQ